MFCMHNGTRVVLRPRLKEDASKDTYNMVKPKKRGRSQLYHDGDDNIPEEEEGEE